ncbi:hypothetical protein [Streptomyces harbinensis]|uniref:Uncharacterized protein n=1 Tax=Streptomyces harbinensis TaxID=1176198 RepID=A0A1I6WB75_9ACTN|nr:hypothetical protein [Streptomyces harbinensis]SFT23220.1 hypothetical protein SAMN05444716_1172 [Streptomyces harbinensis]
MRQPCPGAYRAPQRILAAIADRDAARVFARSQAITPLELPDLGMYLQPADSSGGTVVADLSGSGAVYTTRQRDWDGIGEHDTAYEVHRTTVVDALRDTAQGVTTWWAHQERHDGRGAPGLRSWRTTASSWPWRCCAP